MSDAATAPMIGCGMVEGVEATAPIQSQVEETQSAIGDGKHCCQKGSDRDLSKSSAAGAVSDRFARPLWTIGMPATDSKTSHSFKGGYRSESLSPTAGRSLPPGTGVWFGVHESG